ncbi:MAG TPA: c-type cytochrome [Terriglobia bacterium]|nr:c-type cytochrome [Terriglobia bacterium]
MNRSLRRARKAAGLGALALVMSACTAHEKPSMVETALANVAKDIVIPIKAESLKNPFQNNSQAASEGEQVYLQSCAVCHGPDGHSQTTLGQAMYPPAMDLTSPHVQHWDDGEMFWIIQNGVRMTGMASWKGAITPDETWKLVIFIRHLPELDAAGALIHGKEQAPPKTEEQLITAGRALYRQEGCFICHRLDGEGTQVGPDLTKEGTRGRSAAWLIGHFKDPGAYVPGSIMPSFKNLTDEQLRALTAFLLHQTGVERSSYTR